MPAVHYTNLLIVVTIGLHAPLALGFFPRFRLPAIVLSFAIAITLGIGLKGGGFVNSPLFVAIVLAASSVSVIFPVMKDANVTSSHFGQLVLASASLAEFGAIILLSLFFSGKGSSSATGTLILVGVFGLVVALAGVALAGVERSISLSHVLRRLQDTTA
jgi:Kef-type K+ transport system membrane component KefB